MSSRIWTVIGASIWLMRDLLLHLALQVLQARHLGAHLLGLQRLQVDGGALGLDLAALHLPAWCAVRSWPPPLITCDASPAPEPPVVIATFNGELK